MAKYIDADKLRAEIKFAKSVYSHPNRVIHGVADGFRQDGRAAMCDDILKKIDSLQQEQPEESLGKTLDEAANKFAVFYDQGTCDGIAQDCFKAGAELQKEQDQPITGNSLEKEWLRYVNKAKKEYGGELPSLGEYGWLQIARHFAEWQKAKMMKAAVDTYVDDLNGDIYNRCIEMGFTGEDEVKLIIVKDD